MAIKLKNNNKKIMQKKWLLYMLLIPMLMSGIFMCSYPQLKQNSKEYYENPLESEAFIDILYRSNCVLYKELYEKVNGVQVSFHELYLENIEDESMTHDFFTSDFEDTFHDLSQFVDYSITDNKTNVKISNSGKDMSSSETFYVYVKVSYDENGHVGSVAVRGEESDTFLKRVSEIGRKNPLEDYLTEFKNRYGIEVLNAKTPINCTIAYGITAENANKFWEGSYYNFQIIDYLVYINSAKHYIEEHLEDLFLFLMFAVILCGILLPIDVEKPWKHRTFRLPIEILFCVFYFFLYMRYQYIYHAVELLSGNMIKNFSQYLGMNTHASDLICYWMNFFFGAAVFALLLYMVYNLLQIREIGWKAYIKRYSYIYRFFPFLKRQWEKFYAYTTSFHVSADTNKVIIRVLIANGIVVFLFCCFWFFGTLGVVIYSLLLYLILRKYVSDLKKKYEILLEATNRIADGNLNVSIEENLGVFEPFKPQVEKIQVGFRNAVEEEVKSQRMKTELITNVSHDLKTPLTAIITYVDLLKNENLTAEQRREYIDTLERKSMRLKVLIEDLFEVSKANSRNMTLNLVDVDIVNLLKQVQLEQEEKLQAAGLSVRLNACEEKIMLKLDSQKTYRIYENLLVNITKYAMHNTRVYVDVTEENGMVSVVMKNISATELTVNPIELTERFVRGDASRNTEGSGLGLAIAKSFVELQNGKMSIEIDGDLFKVTTVWYK